MRKLVHNPGRQKLPAIDKRVIRRLCGAASWPGSPGPTLRIQQLCVLTRAPSLTCCGTFYKSLNSSHENKHRHQCPRIDPRESDRVHRRQKLTLPFFLAWHQGTVLWKTIFPQARGGGNGLGMIQVHCICCALYFYYNYISSTSDHQALDPRGWGPLIQITVFPRGNNLMMSPEKGFC